MFFKQLNTNKIKSKSKHLNLLSYSDKFAYTFKIDLTKEPDFSNFTFFGNNPLFFPLINMIHY